MADKPDSQRVSEASLAYVLPLSQLSSFAITCASSTGMIRVLNLAQIFVPNISVLTDGNTALGNTGP